MSQKFLFTINYICVYWICYHYTLWENCISLIFICILFKALFKLSEFLNNQLWLHLTCPSKTYLLLLWPASECALHRLVYKHCMHWWDIKSCKHISNNNYFSSSELSFILLANKCLCLLPICFCSLVICCTAHYNFDFALIYIITMPVRSKINNFII